MRFFSCGYFYFLSSANFQFYLMFKNSQELQKHPVIKWMSVELEQMKRTTCSPTIALCQGCDYNRKSLSKRWNWANCLHQISDKFSVSMPWYVLAQIVSINFFRTQVKSNWINGDNFTIFRGVDPYLPDSRAWSLKQKHCNSPWYV